MRVGDPIVAKEPRETLLLRARVVSHVSKHTQLSEMLSSSSYQLEVLSRVPAVLRRD